MKEHYDELQTLDDNNQFVKDRIPNAASAKAQFEKTLENWKSTAMARAKIRGLIDGNAPFKDSDLKRLGQSWRANVNFREAEAIIDSNASGYWELIMEVPTFINVEVDDDDNQMQPSEDYGAVIAEEYTRLLKRWNGYYYHMMMITNEFLVDGKSAALFPDEYDWKFDSCKSASILVPAKTKSTVEEFKLVYIRDEMYLHEIYEKIEDDKISELAKSQGWNIEALKMALILVYKKGMHIDNSKRYQLSEWEDVQQAIKNNDFDVNEADSEGLHIVHILTKEVNGKISHKIILEDTNLVWEDVEEEQFMFSGETRYTEFNNVINPFFYGIGDGYFKSVKGLGHRVFPHVSYSDRFINNALDGAGIAGSLILKRDMAPGAEDSDVRMLKVGPITVIPDGYTPIQTSFSPPVDNLIAVRSMLTGIMNNNTGVQRPRQEDPNQVEKTARQAMIEESKEARFEKNKITFFYIQWDMLHQEIFRRLVSPDYPKSANGYEQAQRFRQRCLARGVPESLLNPEAVYVTASRGIGLGSPAMKSMVTSELLNLTPLLDERGKINAIRDWLAARVGYTNVNRYASLQNRNLIPTSEHSMATLEHNDLVEGKPVPVGVDQPHVIHLNIHLPKLTEVVEIFNKQPQSLNLDMVIPYFQVALPHTGEHIDLLMKTPDRREMANQYKQVFDVVVQTFKKMQSNYAQIQAAKQAQMQQQQQAAAGQPTKEQMEMQLKAQAQQFDQALEQQKQESIMKMREIKAAHAIDLKNQIASAEIERKRAVAQAEGVEA